MESTRIVRSQEGGAVDVRLDTAHRRVYVGTLAKSEVAMVGSEIKELIMQLCEAYKGLTGRFPFEQPAPRS